jgi:hypothetical protein
MTDTSPSEGDQGEYEDADELEISVGWEAVGVTEQATLDEQWLTYLAQADIPSGVEGVDLGITDYEERAGGQEVGYA